MSVRFLSMVVVAGTLLAQPADRAAQVRSLNNEILLLHSQAQQGAANAALNSKAADVLSRRAAALEALAAEQPKLALQLAFSPDFLKDVTARFPASAALLEQHGSFEGLAEYLVLDDIDHRSAKALIRVLTSNGPLSVHFAANEPPNLKCSDRLRVDGVKVGTTVAAADGKVTAVAAAGTVCSPTGEQKAIVLMVTFPGVTAPALTQQSIYDIFFATSGRSLDRYWREASYGKTWATGAVYGWYTLDAVYSCDQYYAMRDAALRAADADVDFRQYNRIYIVFPPQGSGCNWSGLGTIGCSSLSTAGDGSFTSSVAWLAAGYMNSRDNGTYLTAHEGGHNLGLSHARSTDYGTQALGAVGSTGSKNEYGDNFSTMGYWNFGHYSVAHKLRLGWLTNTNVPTVQSSGTYSILPIETASAGVQGLRVQRGTGNNEWIWLEYRQPTGDYDSAIGSQVFGGALAHFENSSTGGYTDIIDYTPATDSWSDPALASATTWVDPYSNLTVAVQPAAGGALSVNLTYGSLPCVRANPTLTLSPANPTGYAGSNVSYAMSITNNDSAGCANSTFSIGSTLPSGWTTAFGQTAVTLMPGQKTSVTMTKTVPAGTAAAVYGVNASLQSANGSATGTANCTVAAQAAVAMTLSVPAGPFSARQNVGIYASVTSNGSALSGAPVRFSMLEPNGITNVKTVTTDSTGRAVWTYRVANNDPKGIYSVTATTTSGTQTISAGPNTFTVR